MIIIFVVVRALARLEKEIARDHLEDGTGEGPDVGRSVIIGANNYFR